MSDHPNIQEWLTGPDARMDAYYYSFDRTGDTGVDSVLSAVATAGKGAHHTQDWTDELTFDYGPVAKGGTLADLIQEAARQAAERHAAELRKAKAEAFEEGLAAVEDLIAVRDMVGFTPATINPYSGDRIEGDQ